VVFLTAFSYLVHPTEVSIRPTCPLSVPGSGMLFRMRGSRPALLLAAAALLLLVVFAARGESSVPSSLTDLSLERGLPGVILGGSSAPSLSSPIHIDADPNLVAKIVIVLVVVALVLAVVLSVLSARRVRRRAGVGDVIESVEGTIDTILRLRLKEAVEQARDMLASPGGEPRDAVIRAWVTIEGATEHRRAPHQTATEFTVALLEKETADEDALRELRTLYQRARFGHHSDESDAAAARTALDRILATIR
jgi:Domain of unknown function (DUF4129)